MRRSALITKYFLKDLGIDLGTANCLVYERGKGIVLREPSVVAVRRLTREILAIGEEARQMIGRTPADILAVRPLRHGVIADFDLTREMLRHLIRRVCGRRVFLRPRVVVSVPAGTTEVERRAVIEAMAPDRMRYRLAGGGEVVTVGAAQQYREPGGTWQRFERATPLRFPDYSWYAHATAHTLGRRETLPQAGGEEARVVSF